MPIRGTKSYVRSSQLRVLPVVLHEAAGERLDGLGVVDGGEQVTLADVRAGGAADVDLPAAAVDRATIPTSLT